MAQLGIGEVRDQLPQVVDAVIDEAQHSAGIGRVAAALVLGRSLQHQDLRAVIVRGKRRAGGGIAGPDDDDIEFQRIMTSSILPVARSNQFTDPGED